MVLRNMVIIDEDKCDGCGLCISACAEGAIKLIDGKAKLVSETYCDGLGACLGHCPQDAITVEHCECAEFDEKAVAINGDIIKTETVRAV
ncbi:MAG: 4Fe-4S binding protein [Anaerohalosphaeraceae bacterium]|nr:4Fe-4S binding protein [Anaerohalosphaeraceae bacterium]